MIESKRLHQVWYYSQRAFWVFIDWIFPPECPGCEITGERWCAACQSKVEAIPEPYCEFCGDVLVEGNICSRCKKSRPSFERLRSWSVFKEPVRSLIHAIKYQNGLGLGDSLSQPLAMYLKKLNWPIDAIIPVPLSKNRMQERGYNQVDIVAWPLAEYLGLDYYANALTRAKHTNSQVGLSAEERRENVKGAFVAVPEQIAGKTILLMDDVVTTGATMREASTALLDAGASKVYGFSIARALAVHGWDKLD